MQDIFGRNIVEGDWVAYVVRYGSSVNMHIGMCVKDNKFVCCMKDWGDKWVLIKNGSCITLSHPTLVRINEVDVPGDMGEILYNAYCDALDI